MQKGRRCGAKTCVNAYDTAVYLVAVSNRFSFDCHTTSFAMDSSEAKLNLCALQPVVTCHLEPF